MAQITLNTTDNLPTLRTALNTMFAELYGMMQVETPTFDPVAGTYSGAQSVTITTATAGATIRYTTDGSTPSESVGTIYSAPVSVTESGTLKAIAYRSGFTTSAVASADYTITPAELPTADLEFDLNAVELAYANATPIDNGSNKWTDQSAAANHGVQATSGQRPVVATATARDGVGRTIDFDGAAGASADRVTLTTPVSLTADFSAFAVVKGTAGMLFGKADLSHQLMGMSLQTASAGATLAGDAVDSIDITGEGGGYTTAPAVTISGDGTGAEATAVLTNGRVTSVNVTNGGSGYSSATVSFDDPPNAVLSLYNASVVTSTTIGTPAATAAAFGIYEIHRDGSNNITFFKDGVACGTGTLAGTFTIEEVGRLFDGNVERLVLYSAQQTGADLTACRAALA